jgi:hypothetical protein
MGNLNKRKTKRIICNNCGIEFEKAISEIKRNKNHFCSLRCSAIFRNDINKKNFKGYSGNPKYLITYNCSDEYTGFREFLRRARNRKNLGDLTLIDLKEQWNKQNGECPYTGIKLKLPSSTIKHQLFELASLDRINSNKQYERGNVVFVSTPINYMKNSMTEKETIEYCKKIAYFWKNK